MLEIKNGRLGLYGRKHSKCNHMMTMGFKGLSTVILILDDRQAKRPTDKETKAEANSRLGGQFYRVPSGSLATL